MVSIESYGSTKHIRGFFKKTKQRNFVRELNYWGQLGAELLSMATPVYTGRAAMSWGYEIEENDGNITLYWTNDDIENGESVVMLIQYGHATKSGSWVEGVDFINPALRPLFDEIKEDVLKEVRKH
jgi:hypothetical protein